MHTSRPRSPRLHRGVLIGAAAVALALLPALPASAHDQLVSATPAAGSTVTTATTAVDLTFNAAVLELGGGRNAVEVTGQGGRHFETACATSTGTTVAVPVELGGGGTYTVTWRAVSSDGHAVSDAYTFDYRPAAGIAAAAGAATSPCATAGEAARPTASTGVADGAILTGAIAGVVLLAAVAAVLVVVLRLRRRDDQEVQR